VERPTLIGRNDAWKFDASNTDLGTAWRADIYDDHTWSINAAIFSAGSGAVDGIGPERLTNVAVSASSELTTNNRLAIDAVNGAGLIGNAHVNTPDGMMWLSRGTFAVPNDLNPQITFDLGAMLPLRSLKVWNYNEDLPGRPELLARGIATGNILVGADPGALNTLVVGQTFNKAPGTFTDFSQLIDLGGIQTRYVRLDQLTNFPGGDLNFVGLSEVQFFRDPDLTRTALPLGPVTYYFRKTFDFAGDPTRTRLFLDAAVDDGAVFYLNGVEVRRLNMPAGAVVHGTLAASAVAHAVFSGPIEIPTTSLRSGPNVLAVEVHQAAANADPDMVFGAVLSAEIAAPGLEAFSRGNLRFNELTAASLTSFQIELVNQGTEPLDAGGFIVRRSGPSPDASHTLGSQIIPPGGFLVFSQSTLGFGAVPGDKLFLLRPGGQSVADAIEVHERARSRSPDGTGEWFISSASTLGSNNAVNLRNEIVFNEIFYHGPPTLEVPATFDTNIVISFTNVWRYEQSGEDLGTAWRATDYDDSSWASGRGLLGVTASTLPVPKNTDLVFGPTTYYFRASFDYTGSPAFLNLNLRHVVDDGVVLYLNGVEVNRFNIPSGPPGYLTNASAQVANALLRNAVSVPLSNLRIGRNVLAAEVHQAAVDGGDVAFAAELTAGFQATPRSPYQASDEEWVELYNRSGHAVNLTGWRLDEGIDFRFPANTT
ncbi:MAG TPA: hypothetical protein VNM37_22460, partial [Candidatus Dormibacteraeota bacterium]|nr:hypothetical protein [Candidatus Dormibacteraeota bacterium]